MTRLLMIYLRLPLFKQAPKLGDILTFGKLISPSELTKQAEFQAKSKVFQDSKVDIGRQSW
jgi:hypothetical protein